MERTLVLKAIADETRMKILTLLLKNNYCVRALARNLELSEAAISQHLKVLREVGLLVGEKHGHFIHYDVERAVLYELAKEIETLAAKKRETHTREKNDCKSSENEKCPVKGECGEGTQEFYHGKNCDEEESYHGNCQYQKS